MRRPMNWPAPASLILLLVVAGAVGDTALAAGLDSDPSPSKVGLVERADGRFEETRPGDPRKVRTHSSPAWLAAVGRMKVNNRLDKKAKSCSITLVSNDRDNDSLLALTAAHCINSFRDGGGTGPDSFTPTRHQIVFTTSSGKELERQITDILAFAYGAGDYAIVRLDREVPNEDIRPLVHSDEHYRKGGYGLLDDPAYQTAFKPFGTVAGYSTDLSPEYGNKGENLTYHEGCYFNGGTDSQKGSGCYSYGGASGGPFVVTVDRGVDEWEERPLLGIEHLLVGIVKGGRDDENERTHFTPHTLYDEELRQIFEEHEVTRSW